MQSHHYFFIAEPLEARQLLAGITLITHGFQSNGAYPQWVDRMAEAVDKRIEPQSASLWTNASLYRMQISSNGTSVNSFSRATGPLPGVSSTGEVVIALDWAAASELGGPSTAVVAQTVATALLGAGTSLGFGGDLLSLPIHIIGHSRGASLVAELGRLLGQRGIWVDQVTTLDPFPLGSDPGPSDSVNLSDNVVFADNYYETSDFFVHGGTVAGAHNTGPLSLPGGSSLAHSDVHTFYDGTIDRAATTDGDVTLNTAWYTSTTQRATIGYDWSRISGGLRPADGLSSLGGGTAARIHVDAVSTTWPDVGSLSITSGGTVSTGGSVGFGFRYQSVSASSEVDFYLDNDNNRRDGFTRALTSAAALAPTGALPSSASGSANYTWSSTGVTPGEYFINAVITDGTHTRFASLSQPVFVTSNGADFATKRWADDTASHDWAEPRNWSPGGVPAMTDLTISDFGTLNLASTVPARAIDLANNAVAHLNAPESIGAIGLANNADAIVMAGGANLLQVQRLSIEGGATLDLNDNDAIIDYTVASPVAQIEASISAARAGGAWTGTGLTSSSAKNSVAHNTTLGAMEATEFKSLGASNTSFDGQSIDDTAVLIKYTYYGDTDFNGTVNFDDYARIDNGFNHQGDPGFAVDWFWGDFDYNSAINFDDYALIDHAFNSDRRAEVAGSTCTRGRGGADCSNLK